MSEELEPIDGYTSVGSYASDKKHDQYRMGKFLYPTYIDWCKREKTSGLNPKGFAESVVNACKLVGYPAEKKRLDAGNIIQGIGI